MNKNIAKHFFKFPFEFREYELTFPHGDKEFVINYSFSEINNHQESYYWQDDMDYFADLEITEEFPVNMSKEYE